MIGAIESGKTTLTYASVCDGIGAAHCAWNPLGMRCAWTSEIDPFPAAVVDHHWDLPNLGDMTAINCKEATDEHGAIDLLVGGTPCQSFSVAGLRKGLDDPRGNLALVYLGLVDQLRPRWVVWENVPGVLSSNEGRDFGAFLGALEQLGYGWSYRTLDAQFVRVESHPHAVPQRRRRVFVVGCARGWGGAGAVLFERESMQGHPPPRRESGQRAAGCLNPGAHPGGFNGQDAYSGHIVAQPFPVANCMTRRMHKGIDSTVDEGQTPVLAFANTAGATNLGISYCEAPPITRRNGDPGNIVIGQSVRRLTPRECERLQGFPDDYTAIEYRGKPAADGPRYKALGNSMAVNVMSWIGQRIAIADEILEGSV